MKIIFLSSDKIALFTFYNLLKYHKIVAVITQPDRSKGRSSELIPSPLAIAAEERNIFLYKNDDISKEIIDELKKLKADLFISFSYGIILKKDFFSVTKMGGINIHPSLLPELRGPSPIQTAILLGMKKSGVTIQKMALKMDSGDILIQKTIDISPEDDEISIEEKVSTIASDLIIYVLEKLEKNDLKPISQEESNATYCRLIKKEYGLIDWKAKGEDIINKVRAFVKWPVAYTFLDKSRVNIYRIKLNNNLKLSNYKSVIEGKIIFADKNNGIVVRASDSLLNIELLQQSGKKILDWKDFLNGYRGLSEKKFCME